MQKTQVFILALSLLLAACKGQQNKEPLTYDLIIRNALVYDGSGEKPVKADVAVQADTIAAVGNLKDAKGIKETDARGMALAPGFIDTHSHADEGIDTHPEALAVVSQGITTVVVGQDGFSALPLAAFFSGLGKNPTSINVASYAGHGIYRDSILGKNYKRSATQEEIEKMKQLLEADMKAGALGLSTGLEYDPALYADTKEIIALAKVVAAHGGRYISHLRNEDRGLWSAVDEIITIGKEAHLPVQISHTKIALRSAWGKADSLLIILEKARAEGVDISADIYPYTYWQSTLAVLFPERNFADRKAAEFALKEAVDGPGGVLLTSFAPDSSYAGKTLAQIALEQKKDPVTALLDLMRLLEAFQKTHTRSGESMIGTSMSEDDIKHLMRWPHMNFCSDGGLSGEHPRSFGSFPRILGYYVREQQTIPLEEAIHKMTSLAAQHMGFSKRGLIKPGYFADLVLFSPSAVADMATPQHPSEISKGILEVWVNGVRVFAEGKVGGNRPGKVIRKN